MTKLPNKFWVQPIQNSVWLPNNPNDKSYVCWSECTPEDLEKGIYRDKNYTLCMYKIPQDDGSFLNQWFYCLSIDREEAKKICESE